MPTLLVISFSGDGHPSVFGGVIEDGDDGQGEVGVGGSRGQTLILNYRRGYGFLPVPLH